MKILKIKSVINNNSKRYLLYAIGELLLIVLGILLALYINNEKDNNKYKKQIDNNFLRAYSELENNIDETIETIQYLREKDSLIYLVMNDTLTANDYNGNISLAYLIINYYNLEIEDKAYQNLISLNVSDNRYNDQLILELKQLYSINKNIKEVNSRMSSFTYDISLPILAHNIKSFGDLTYKGEIKKDAVDYFTNSLEYKSYVSQYAIIAIKNQLRNNQNFLKNAYHLKSQISSKYNLTNNFIKETAKNFIQHEGVYTNKQLKDTLLVKLVNDSLLISKNNGFKLNLIPVNKNVYFTDNENGGGFVSFFRNKNNYEMKLNLLSYKYLYIKTE